MNSSESNIKPTFILSGMSGTGKSGILEDSGQVGIKCVRSFTKFLLDYRFGDGQPTYKFLLMDTFMQIYHIWSANRSTFISDPLMVERSLLDSYFFLTEVNGYEQTETDAKDMYHALDAYFHWITEDGNKPLYIVDIWNLDKDWIARNLEEPNRRKCWTEVDKYLEDQMKYKDWYFAMLTTIGVEFKQINLTICNVAKEFTPELRKLWIKKNILDK